VFVYNIIAQRLDKTNSTLSSLKGEPRCFRFRGLDAPDERVLLYKVKVDSGIDVDQAREIYEDAMKDATVFGDGEDEDDGFIGKSRRTQIKTGFYIDRRQMFKKTPKVFLIINKLSVSLDSSIMVVRPNLGRRFKNVNEIYHQIHTKRQLQFCGTERKIQDAFRIWEKEFQVRSILTTLRTAVNGFL
jgi:hypothetical protein